MIKNKNAAISYLMDIIGSFILWMIIMLFMILAASFLLAGDAIDDLPGGPLKSLTIVGFIGEKLPTPETINIFVSGSTDSRVCNYDLINFLRAVDENSDLTYGQLLILSEKSSDAKTLFEERATNYFEQNYDRFGVFDDWRLSTIDSISIINIGTIALEDFGEGDICSERLPSLNGGSFRVLLEVEY